MNQNIPFPLHGSAVTAGWLTAVLREQGTIRDSRVESLQVEPLNSQGILGHIYRLIPQYNLPEEGQAASLILKYPLPDPDFRTGMAESNRKEVRFYQELASQVGLRTPRMYFAGFDEPSCTSLLLLEDLSAIATPGSLACGCYLLEAEAVIRQMALFHARWWQVPEGALPWIGSKKEWALSNSPTYLLDLLNGFTTKLAAEIPDYPLPVLFHKTARWLAEHYAAVKERLYGSRQTLIHDDWHLANLFFENGASLPKPILVDWHFMSKANGVCDLGYFIGMCLSEEQRQEAESELIRLYHELLIQHGVQDYPFEQFQNEYQLSCIEPLERLCQAIFALDASNPQSRAFFLAILDRLVPYVTHTRARAQFVSQGRSEA